MNHKPMMLTVTAIVAAIAVTGIAAMATPAFAGGDKSASEHKPIKRVFWTTSGSNRFGSTASTTNHLS